MPMVSIWELGAIHRASKWRTLNLSMSPKGAQAQNAEQNFVQKGGGTYQDGDGPILDQVKMTNDLEVLGKINLLNNYDDQTMRHFSLGALFYKMSYRKDGNYLRQQFDDSNNPISGELYPNKVINYSTDVPFITDKTEEGFRAYDYTYKD